MPMNDPQTIDPRRRIRELLSIPDRDRTDAEWDELNELEIRTAPGNRVSGNPDYHGQTDRVGNKRQGQPGQSVGNKKRKDKPHSSHAQQQGQPGGQGQKSAGPRPQEPRPEGSAGNRPSKRQHRRHKQRQGGGGEGGGAPEGGAQQPSGGGSESAPAES